MAPQETESKRRLDLPPDDTIVISGISGRFPNTDSVNEFRDNLYNKVDMISDDPRRWQHSHPEIPKRAGKLNTLNDFDAGVFGIHRKHVDTMDPMCRLLLENTYEAILDAGMHPSELEDTNTGVFVGACMSETEKYMMYDNLVKGGSSIAGNTRTVLCNRISYWLKLRGPSFISDSACSSSLYAFDQAYLALREGRCDRAIVASANLCLHPYVSLQFARLGVLSPDGSCKSFDNGANGYARSEGVTVLILQSAKNARRIYAEVIHSKTNCDGYKQEGITYPSGQVQMGLLEDFYKECGRSPTCLSYMEAHGTGTPVGDPEELNAIDKVFAMNRDTPLHIGTVKSNIGHNEPVSGLCSIAKVIIGFENGMIPPNMNFKEIRKGVEGLEKQRMFVVSEKIPWPDNNGLVGINSFGFGGGNCHILLRWNFKLKLNEGQPADELPRLVCVSSRTSEAVLKIFEDLASRKLDAEHVALYHNIYKRSHLAHFFRGYALISKSGTIEEAVEYNEERKKLYVLFGNVNGKLPLLIGNLMELDVFKQVFQRFQDIFALKKLIFDPNKILTSYEENNVIHQILGTVIVQMGVYEVLKVLEVVPEGVFGVSVGVLTASYAKNFLTFEEVVIITYFIALIFNEHGKKIEYGVQNIQPEDVPKLAPKMHEFLKQLIVNKNNRDLNKEERHFVDYLIESLLSKNNIEPKTPLNSIVLECGSQRTECTNVMKILDSECSNGVENLLLKIGRLFTMGYDINLEKLYPKVEFPVSRGTPMISHLVQLKHGQKWQVLNSSGGDQTMKGFKKVLIGVQTKEWLYLGGHVVDGRNLFPATGYLYLVWTVFASTKGKELDKMHITFENVKFIRAVNLPKSGKVEMIIVIFKESGDFELTEGGGVVATGRILENVDEELIYLDLQPSNKIDPPMKEKDIYKELRLRGYNYSGLFRGLKESDVGAVRGLVEWKNNWVAFLDNMLQMLILQEDTRSLYVPTGIFKMVINAPKHLQHIKELGDEPLLDVNVWKNINLIRCGAVELRGMNASSISRRKPRAEPVLEYYKFLPNHTSLPLEQAIRVIIQIVLENVPGIKVKTVELIGGEDVKEDYSFLSPMILQVLGDLPLMQPNVVIYSKNTLEVEHITVEDKELNKDTEALIVVGTNFLSQPQTAQNALVGLKENGFLISRESIGSELSTNLQIYGTYTTDTEKIYLLRKSVEPKKTTYFNVSNSMSSFDWLTALQNAIKSDSQLVVYAQEDLDNGILGLVNCMRREAGGDRFRCLFIKDKAPDFDANSDFYKTHLAKGFAFNVFCDGQWGTYRHLLLEQSPPYTYTPIHKYVNTIVPGDLSSLRWLQGPLNPSESSDFVTINYAALNFRDIMTGSGRLNADIISRNRMEQLCLLGFEYSGVDNRGRRVMGCINNGALSTLVTPDRCLLWNVPDEWSLMEAATVPIVYSTCLYGLLHIGKLKRGESILIHSGTGGVGQAAINIALYYECTIFTTVGTQEKRDFLHEHFPQIPDSHIGNSRDTSFVQMIFEMTEGRGVDAVLNSLAEEKLLASLQCLAPGGRFLEIGKFDLGTNNPLPLEMLTEGRTFHGIMLDMLFHKDPRLKRPLLQLLATSIDEGMVKPLVSKVFNQDDVEAAFRHMATGKHMGKVLIKVKEENADAVQIEANCLPRIYCHPEKTTVILGGLGGFGLELADWLVLRGARHLILTSRKGITTGYQALRIRAWETYGVNVMVVTDDVATRKGCESLLVKANRIGDVENIFNLAVVLRDKFLENQTIEDFETSFAPKAFGTVYLDELSRTLCPKLRNFVVFSSVSCGRGNAGQTNYGMANSIMERICEKRKKDGLPALAIQWGAVGDVGLVAEMQEIATDIVIGGTLQQRISNCLSLLDQLMSQDEPIVASMVVAEKRIGSGELSVIETIANILGIRNIKTVSPHATLPELGMDSMMGVEVKQTLEREYDIFLTPQDIRTMTFARLKEILDEKENGKSDTDDKKSMANVLNLFQFIEDEEAAKLPIVKMQTDVLDTEPAPKVYLLPGVEGMSSSLKGLCKNIKAHAWCLQFCYGRPEDTIQELAKIILQTAVENIEKKEPFTLIAHSFGAVVALELMTNLEKLGYKGRAIFIDGAPVLFKEMAMRQLQTENESQLQMSVLCGLMSQVISLEIILKHKDAIEQCETFQERIDFLIDHSETEVPFSREYQTQVCIAFYKRIKAIMIYENTDWKIKSQIKLFKPTVATIIDLAEDFHLGEICEQPVELKYFEGNHSSILESPQLSQAINKELGYEEVHLKEPLMDVEHISTKIEALKP